MNLPANVVANGNYQFPIPAPRSPSSDNASGTHHGHAAEVTNGGGTTGIMVRRECVAMASGAGFGSSPSNYAWLTSINGIPAWWPRASQSGADKLALALVDLLHAAPSSPELEHDHG